MNVQYLIIGGGVVGLALAKNISKVTSSVLLVEKNKLLINNFKTL